MRIAEMEAHHQDFLALEHTVGTMVRNREFPRVFSVCEACFPHVVPAINFRKKRDIRPEIPELLAFQVICNYAPALFEHAVLESLADFVKSTRLLAKHENGYLQTVEVAIEQEEVARGIWNYLERRGECQEPDVRKELGLGERSAAGIIEMWAHLGIIDCEQQGDTRSLRFRTRLEMVVEGICHACGARGKGPKEAFLRPSCCQRCGTQGYYHIVGGRQ
ncbi:MAG TPA: hypothetical protein VMY37_31605 [Thermoguttaceae bacterium]|nr:hypothetical protein [Thermoguttaceae bacterium]